MEECCSEQKVCAAAGGSLPGANVFVSVERSLLLRRALSLALLTVAWNIVEGAVAVSAAVAADSVALLGFGIDSFVETASAAVMVWRLRAERHGLVRDQIEAVEERSRKLVAASLFLLAAWVMFDASKALWLREQPEPSVVGVGVTALSLGVMMWLARAKRRVAVALGSRAMEADAFQTTACWWLSLTTLGGIGVNALFGWWWADPVSALGVTFFLVREGREAWRGDDCCS